MSSEWPIVQLGGCAELFTGFPFKSADYTDEPTGVRLLRGDNIGQGVLRWDGVKKWPQGKSGVIRQYELEEADIVLAMDRPWIPAGLKFGRVRKTDLPALLVQRVARLRPTARINADYLYYVIASREFTEYIQNVTTGTAVPHISATQIRDFKFALPDLRTQVEAGKLLASLDDRIALLREANATLEAIAQALFKSWFIDFDPVRAKQQGLSPEGMDEATAALFPDSFEESELGLVPRGWRWVTLADAYEINPQRRLKKGEIASYLDMASVPTAGHCAESVVQREMGSGSKFRNGDTLLARITPCLENGKTVFVDFLLDEQIGWGSTEFVVLRPRNPLPPYHGYLLSRHPAFREHAVQSMSGTSGRQRVQNDVLGRYPVVVPCAGIGEAFGEVVGSVQQKIAANHAQAQTLATLRDTLLPRLISGQLRLPEAEAKLEKAAA